MILGALAPAALLLGGCGGDEPEKERASSSGGTASARGSDACGHDEDSLVPAMRSAYDEARTVRMDMVLIEDYERTEMESTVVHTPKGSDLEFAYRDSESGVVIRVVGGRVFVSDDADGPFDEIDESDDLHSQFREMMAVVDLGSQLTLFEKSLVAVEAGGEAVIGGVTTCRYTMTVDTARAAKADGTSAEGLPETVDYEAFVDADDLLRRLTFTLGLMKSETGVVWNEPVRIKVPRGADKGVRSS
ncbi:MAG: hypothetical protein ACI379_02520 [Nocardioides sp.]|uniref:hypothetical protein n=1 Tax=Nocardioides sp. TaxID=35761 RepID=UPI003F0E024E